MSCVNWWARLNYVNYHSPMAQQLLVVKVFLIIGDSRSHSDTPYSVGILCKGDQPDAEPSTLLHSTFTTDKHPCSRRDKNPQSKQASDRKPMALTAQSLGSAHVQNTNTSDIKGVHMFSRL